MSCDEIYALKLRFTFPKSMFNELVKCVQHEQRERIMRFRFYEDALRTLTTHILIRKVIIDKIRIKNSEVFFKRGSVWKTLFTERPYLHFNLLHSSEWVVCCISNAPIGIDIEE